MWLQPRRFLTLEKKAVMVDAFAKWRVKDAERFYTATSGMKQIADERLSRRLESGLRDQIEVPTGANIPWIFDKEGEPGFRDRETAMIVGCLLRAPCLRVQAVWCPARLKR